MTSLKPVPNAIQYWEKKRLIYNAVLAAVVVLGFALEWPRSRTWFEPPASPVFLQAAIGANILFCAAYLADWAIRLTPLKSHLAQGRRVIFVGGVLLAVPLALAIVTIIAIGPMSN